MENFFEQINTGKNRLEEIKKTDSELREKLENHFSDDETFYEAAKNLAEFAKNAGDETYSGLEQARAFAAVESTVAKMKATKRGETMEKFLEISKERERLEEEAGKAKLAEEEQWRRTKDENKFE